MLISLGGVMGGMLCAGSDKEGAEITNRPTTLMRRMAHGLMSERMQHIYLARRNRNGWVEDAGLKKEGRWSRGKAVGLSSCGS
jgi:hypothetical protein